MRAQYATRAAQQNFVEVASDCISLIDQLHAESGPRTAIACVPQMLKPTRQHHQMNFLRLMKRQRASPLDTAPSHPRLSKWVIIDVTPADSLTKGQLPPASNFTSALSLRLAGLSMLHRSRREDGWS